LETFTVPGTLSDHFRCCCRRGHIVRRDAYVALLFEDNTDFIECPDLQTGQGLVIKHLGDELGVSMKECPTEDVVAFVLQYNSEDTREDQFISSRLALAIDQQKVFT
jgi:hypothetical protein